MFEKYVQSNNTQCLDLSLDLAFVLDQNRYHAPPRHIAQWTMSGGKNEQGSGVKEGTEEAWVNARLLDRSVDVVLLEVRSMSGGFLPAVWNGKFGMMGWEGVSEKIWVKQSKSGWNSLKKGIFANG